MSAGLATLDLLTPPSTTCSNAARPRSKRDWLALAAVAEAEVLRAASAGVELGVAFVADDGQIAWFDVPGVRVHHATLGGVVPRLVGP